MKHSKKLFLPLILLPIFFLSGCFEINYSAQQTFSRYASVCPLNGTKKYQITTNKNGKFVKSGIIRAENASGGTCALKDLENVDFETSRAILEMLKVNFYIVHPNVSISFKAKTGAANNAIIFSQINKDGKILFYANCDAKNVKSQKIISNANIQINGDVCLINNAEQVQTIANSIDNFAPKYILTPL